MSRKDKKYVLRHLRCEGCWRGCRYRDFRGHVPANPKRAPAWSSFKEVARELHLHAKESNEGKRDEVVRVTRCKILGRIYQQKMDIWEQVTENCPYKGEDPFASMELAIEWLLAQPSWKALSFLRGINEEAAKKLKIAPTLRDFWTWWSNKEKPPF